MMYKISQLLSGCIFQGAAGVFVEDLCLAARPSVRYSGYVMCVVLLL